MRKCLLRESNHMIKLNFTMHYKTEYLCIMEFEMKNLQLDELI